MQKTQSSGLLQQSVSASGHEARPATIWSLQEWELAIVFVGLYLVFERVSFIHPWSSTGITPWNPQIALALGLVLIRGVRAAPALFLAMLISETLVRQSPAPLLAVVVGSTIMAGGYTAAGVVLSRRLSVRGRIRSLRDLAWMLGVLS